VGTADIKNKADTDSSDGKLGALEQAEVWWFPFREFTTHGTPDEKKGGGKGNFFRGQYRNTSNGKSEKGNHSKMKKAK
jgi:hypothetical protein